MIKLDVWPVLQILLLIVLLLPAKRLVAIGEIFGSLASVLVVYFTLLLAAVLWLVVGTKSYALQLFGQFEWRYLFQGLLWGIGLYFVGIVGYILAQKLLGLQQPKEVGLFSTKGLSAVMVIGIILVGPVLEEYVFRLQRRSSKARGMLFYRLLEQAVCIDPLPYKKIVDG